MTRTRLGQTVIEYTMIIAVVTVVFYYIGTGVKRGVQSLVKITADQVGNQQNSDQDFNDSEQGYMNSSLTEMNEDKSKQAQEAGYIPKSGNAIYEGNTAFNESSYTMENTTTNGGFQESGQN